MLMRATKDTKHSTACLVSLNGLLSCLHWLIVRDDKSSDATTEEGISDPLLILSAALHISQKSCI